MATSGKTKSMPARIAVYVIGALLLALGVVLNTKSNLGISTTNSVPSVLNVVVHQHDPNTRMTLVWACNIISFVNKHFGATFKAAYDKDAVAAEKAGEKLSGVQAGAAAKRRTGGVGGGHCCRRRVRCRARSCAHFRTRRRYRHSLRLRPCSLAGHYRLSSEHRRSLGVASCAERAWVRVSCPHPGSWLLLDDPESPEAGLVGVVHEPLLGDDAGD